MLSTVGWTPLKASTCTLVAWDSPWAVTPYPGRSGLGNLSSHSLERTCGPHGGSGACLGRGWFPLSGRSPPVAVFLRRSARCWETSWREGLLSQGLEFAVFRVPGHLSGRQIDCWTDCQPAPQTLTRKMAEPAPGLGEGQSLESPVLLVANTVPTPRHRVPGEPRVGSSNLPHSNHRAPIIVLESKTTTTEDPSNPSHLSPQPGNWGLNWHYQHYDHVAKGHWQLWKESFTFACRKERESCPQTKSRLLVTTSESNKSSSQRLPRATRSRSVVSVFLARRNVLPISLSSQ